MPTQFRYGNVAGSPRGYGIPQDPANPNDPNQLRNWGLGYAQNAMNQSWSQNLFDPATLEQINQFLAPYFKQQQSNYANKFNSALNSQIGQAQNQAGAYAAFKGLNPVSFTQNAGQGVRSRMTPSFMSGLSDLMSNQGNALLGATEQTNRYRQGNAMDYARLLMNGSQQAQQTWDRPGFWDYFLGGLFGSAGELGGAAINKWG